MCDFRFQIVDCVCRGDVQRLSALLPHAGDAVNSPLAPHRDLRTPLHLAAAFPSLSCVQLLLWVSLFGGCSWGGATAVLVLCVFFYYWYIMISILLTCKRLCVEAIKSAVPQLPLLVYRKNTH